MSQDTRLQALEDWLARVAGRPVGPLELVSADASARRYFRLPWGKTTAVAMDAPPEREDTRPFVDVARRLAAAGLDVPTIHQADTTRGFVVMSDLGTTPYLDRGSQLANDGLMEAAIDALVTMQAGAATAGLPTYDSERLSAELDLFPDWYVTRHLGIEPDKPWWQHWRSLRERLIEHALEQPAVFVHRDYMARNLMVTATPPGILDFQDALRGPITYDLASLLRDAFISFPQEREQAWLARYHAAAQDAGLAVPASRDTLEQDWRLMAMQRHLKVLGIFARLAYRDGKPAYLADAPRFLRYVDEEAGALGLDDWFAVAAPLREGVRPCAR
jgi:aminoglycoside/choline kinase family phosphotransferase